MAGLTVALGKCPPPGEAAATSQSRDYPPPVNVDWAGAGLGVQYGSVLLARATDEWSRIGSLLATSVREALPDAAAAVEHIGSTSVPGLLAKPIIDLAIAVQPGVVVKDVAEPLSRLGWIYRGDAGNAGGWVFVLEDSPWHRVAHAHGVEAGGEQWSGYLRFRDLLRSSTAAREVYGQAKERLAELHPDGRAEYTAGKTETVEQLLVTRE